MSESFQSNVEMRKAINCLKTFPGSTSNSFNSAIKSKYHWKANMRNYKIAQFGNICPRIAKKRFFFCWLQDRNSLLCRVPQRLTLLVCQVASFLFILTRPLSLNKTLATYPSQCNYIYFIWDFKFFL